MTAAAALQSVATTVDAIGLRGKGKSNATTSKRIVGPRLGSLADPRGLGNATSTRAFDDTNLPPFEVIGPLTGMNLECVAGT